MAIAFDASATQSTTGANAISWSHAVAAGADRILIVGVSREGGTAGNIVSVTYGSANLTELNETANGQASISVWYLVAPTVGTDTITVTQSTGDTFEMAAGSAGYTGVHQTTPFGTVVTATGLSAAPSVTVASAINELVLGFLSIGIGDTPRTPGAGQTSRYDVASRAGTNGISAALSDEAGAASVVMDYTTPSDDWTMLGVPLKPVAVAASAPLLTMMGAG